MICNLRQCWDIFRIDDADGVADRGDTQIALDYFDADRSDELAIDQAEMDRFNDFNNSITKRNNYSSPFFLRPKIRQKLFLIVTRWTDFNRHIFD